MLEYVFVLSILLFGFVDLHPYHGIQWLQGKRSISDHVHQAGNYIKHLQNNIQELHNNRDQLKRSCNILCSSSTENTQCKMQDSVIIVRPCRAGMEVVVNTPLKQGLPLSRVLEILVGEGLGVGNLP